MFVALGPLERVLLVCLLVVWALGWLQIEREILLPRFLEPDPFLSPVR